MKRLDAGDLFFIILGALILALAVSVGMSAYGYVKVPGILLGAAGIALFLVGLLSAGALGAVLGIIAIAVIVRLIEAFTMPIAIVLGIAGLAVMIFGFKGTNRRHRSGAFSQGAARTLVHSPAPSPSVQGF